MCGIMGYVGHRSALPILLDGLRRLEYRGYDSAGVAVLNDGHIEVRKTAGKLAQLTEITSGPGLLHGTVGIGHTRWATTACRPMPTLILTATAAGGSQAFTTETFKTSRPRN